MSLVSRLGIALGATAAALLGAPSSWFALDEDAAPLVAGPRLERIEWAGPENTFVTGFLPPDQLAVRESSATVCYGWDGRIGDLGLRLPHATVLQALSDSPNSDLLLLSFGGPPSPVARPPANLKRVDRSGTAVWETTVPYQGTRLPGILLGADRVVRGVLAIGHQGQFSVIGIDGEASKLATFEPSARVLGDAVQASEEVFHAALLRSPTSIGLVEFSTESAAMVLEFSTEALLGMGYSDHHGGLIDSGPGTLPFLVLGGVRRGLKSDSMLVGVDLPSGAVLWRRSSSEWRERPTVKALAPFGFSGLGLLAPEDGNFRFVSRAGAGEPVLRAFTNFPLSLGRFDGHPVLVLNSSLGLQLHRIVQ